MSGQISILVVEDEPLLLMDIVDQLQTEGYRVYAAADADKALILLQQHIDIRLIFTDIDMPGSMDGLKLAAAVRDRWPPVKIIVTSGHRAVAQTDLPEGSLFFAKPYDQAAVAASFRAIFAG